MWLDSLHHALHVALTGERDGYYAPFDGSLAEIARELARPEGRRRRLRAEPRPGRQPRHRRPAASEPLRVAQAVVLFSPFTPLLFQGEEYGESRPFQFFTDHIDPFIADATREGGGASSPASRASRPRLCPIRRRERRSSARSSTRSRRTRSSTRLLRLRRELLASSTSRSTRTRAGSSFGAAGHASGRLPLARGRARRVRPWPGSPFRSGRSGTATAPTSRSSPSRDEGRALPLRTRTTASGATSSRAHGVQLARLLPRHRPRPAYGYRVHGRRRPRGPPLNRTSSSSVPTRRRSRVRSWGARQHAPVRPGEAARPRA